MHRPSQIPLRKFLSRHPFNHSPKPTSSFSLNAIVTHSSRPTTPNILISNLHTLLLNHHNVLNRPNTPTQFSAWLNLRRYGSEFDQNKEVDMINLKFAEAREEIEMAMESRETVYFDEEAECARAAVKEVVEMFEGLLARLPESERAALQRSMGLKMEQLKAELQQLND